MNKRRIQLISSQVLFVLVLSTIPLKVSAQEILYGLTQNGGAYDKGVVYQIGADGSNYVVYGDFNGENGAHPGNGSGLTQTDNNDDRGAFVALTKNGGGSGDYGMRVGIMSGIGAFVPPFRFQFTETDAGMHPWGKFLLGPDGYLYGLSSNGGRLGEGTLFNSRTQVSNNPSNAIQFDGVSRGRAPKGSLIQGPMGLMFGMTEFGGTSDRGIIFSYNFTNNSFTKLHDFDGSVTGAYPRGSLVLASDGKLYGMTKSGGSENMGTVFSINIDGSGFTKLADLTTTTGGTPQGALIEFSEGKLYGLTSSGGAHGFGTIFNISLTGELNKVLDFDGSNGKSPLGDLVVSTNEEVMYGVTYSGGEYDKGVIFKLVNGSSLIKIYDFEGSKGSNPVGTLSVRRSNPGLTFPEIEPKLTTSEAFMPNISTESGLPIQLVSMDESVAVIEGDKVKIVGAGYTDIIAYIVGNHQHMSQAVTRQIEVERATQTIDFPPIPDLTYGDQPYKLKATASSGLPVKFSLSFGDEYQITKAGTFTIQAVQEGNEFYEPVEAYQTFVVHRAEQSIDFVIDDEIACCQPINLEATASSGLKVYFKTEDWEKLAIEGTQAAIYGLGTAEIIAYCEGDDNYKPAEKKISVNILKGKQSIDFNLPKKSFQFGDQDLFAPSSSSSGLPVTYSSEIAGVAVYERGTLRLLGVGTTTITATQEGNDLMGSADPVSQTITINSPLIPSSENSIEWAPIYDKFLNDPPFNLLAKASTGLPVTYSSSNQDVAEVSGNLVKIKGIGSTVITAKQEGNDTIKAANPVQQTLHVSKKYQSISRLDLYSVNYGVTPMPLNSRSNEGLPLNYTSSNPSVAYVDENYFLHIINSGTVNITSAQEGDEYYLPASPQSDRFNIYSINQKISFDSIPEKIFGDIPFELTAESSSGYEIEFESDNDEIATVEGNLVTIHGAGVTMIKAKQDGSPGYNPSEISMPLVVKKIEQEIIFDPLPEKKFSDYSFEISATSSAGLPVLFKSSNTAVAQIEGNSIIIVGAGSADIIAYQPGNDNYNEAEIAQELKVADSGKEFGMFGITYSGGMNNDGTVFGMQSDGTNYKILKDFASFTPGFPEGGLIKGRDGRLYGAFSASGSKGRGALMRFDEDGSGMKELYAFDIASGWDLNGGLIQGSDGFIYGTTRKGGAYSLGTIYKINIDGTSHKVLRDLSEIDGTLPTGGLLEATDGKLYGMTSSQGFYGSGTIYRVNKDGTEFEVIFRFSSRAPYKTGDTPRGELIEGSDGYLYGIMYRRGEYGKGVLFKIQKDGSDHTKLVDFDGVNYGGYPGGTLLIGPDGKIYGTTQNGGDNDLGTLYSVNTDGSNFTRLFSFDGASTGSEPLCQLTEASDGVLYGLTKAGGANSKGTVFSINRDGSNFKKLIDLEGTLSSGSNGPLLEVTPGKFIGVTTFGGNGNLGTVFSVNSDGKYKLINEFPREAGVVPINFISDNIGDFYYGLTLGGGPSGNGCIFRISEQGDFLQFDLPIEVFPSKIFYVSTGHVWVSGTRDGEDIVFRIKGDGTEYEVLTEIEGNIPSKIEWITDTYEGEVIGITVRSGGQGVIFKVKNDGTGYTKIGDMPNGVEFVKSSYVYASDGNIYAISGYSHDFYKISTDGNVEHLAELPSEIGQVPLKVVEMNGGNIGALMSSSGVISVGKDGENYKMIYEKDVNFVLEDMIQSYDGWIYVTERNQGINGYGQILRLKSDGSSFKSIHDYNNINGAAPQAILFKKLSQQFEFDPLPKVKVNEYDLKPKASTTSGAKVNFTSSDTTVAVVKYGLINPVGGGTVTVTASVPFNSNYFPVAPIQRELVVEKIDQEITFIHPGDKMFGDDPFLIEATSSSGLPVSYQTTSSSIYMHKDSVYISEAGAAKIEAYQEGNQIYNPASVVSVNFCVIPAKPTISLLSSGNQIVLESSNEVGNQWYLNGMQIPDAEGETIVANEIGTYTVMSTIEGCSSFMSEPYNTLVTGIEEAAEFNIRVFPNPTENEVNVEVNNLDGIGTIELIDPLGRTIALKEYTGSGKHVFEIGSHIKGMYVVKVVSGRSVLIRKLVKK
ncbi:choice-of-anchor tandem repeat GloVer-containing protein [Echinicola sp. 20G]|uniref:choice-of-anchor tandem repeat GloVer-containing protein n=1 Tax=Echinicola sp. 20G TaxID=2781961 RepID=UPI00191101F8|nr:choice-of-anchor tandem repeat GloVer-containing protein [Echinicola sp. 20G]